MLLPHVWSFGLLSFSRGAPVLQFNWTPKSHDVLMFVSENTLNKAVMTQSVIVLIALANRTMSNIIFVWRQT